jgi:Cytochrome P460
MTTRGRRTLLVAAIVGVLFGGLAVGHAGSDTVAYPANYRRAFVEYGVVDVPAVKRVRIYYVAPEMLSAAAPDRPLPDGTVLVMEVRDATLDAGGQPLRDVAGRFIAGDRVIGLWVQAKAGGAWAWARFNADGTRVTDAQLDRCVACHMTRAAQDFTYLLWKYVAAIKTP